MLNIIKYTHDRFNDLVNATNSFQQKTPLAHETFVKHYYTNNKWSHLYLLINKKENIIGTLGIEYMPFIYNGKEITLGFGSNYFTNNNFPGSGAFLYLRWMKKCDFGIVFGGSREVHKIYRNQKWVYYHGTKVYTLNKVPIYYPNVPIWKSALNIIRSYIPKKKIDNCMSNMPTDGFKGLKLIKESKFSEDMIPAYSPFNFRFNPSAEYIQWRYAMDLPYVKYILYRIINSNYDTVGYVILNQSINRIIVSHCDGITPKLLVHGILLSLVETLKNNTSNPEIILASTHPEMQKYYSLFGFKSTYFNRPFAIGSSGKKPNINHDTSDWLINYDWGDNGLRYPFLDSD